MASEYARTHQNDKHFTHPIIGKWSHLTIFPIALIRPRWFAVTQTNTMLAISLQFIYAPVVTLRVVVMATQFVTLQHGWTLVGEATTVPMVRVG